MQRRHHFYVCFGFISLVFSILCFLFPSWSLKSHWELLTLMLTFLKVIAALNLRWLVSCEGKCRPFPPPLCFKEPSKPGLFSKRFSSRGGFLKPWYTSPWHPINLFLRSESCYKVTSRGGRRGCVACPRLGPPVGRTRQAGSCGSSQAPATHQGLWAKFQTWQVARCFSVRVTSIA